MSAIFTKSRPAKELMGKLGEDAVCKQLMKEDKFIKYNTNQGPGKSDNGFDVLINDGGIICGVEVKTLLGRKESGEHYKTAFLQIKNGLGFEAWLYNDDTLWVTLVNFTTGWAYTYWKEDLRDWCIKNKHSIFKAEDAENAWGIRINWETPEAGFRDKVLLDIDKTKWNEMKMQENNTLLKSWNERKTL